MYYYHVDYSLSDGRKGNAFVAMKHRIEYQSDIEKLKNLLAEEIDARAEQILIHNLIQLQGEKRRR